MSFESRLERVLLATTKMEGSLSPGSREEASAAIAVLEGILTPDNEVSSERSGETEVVIEPTAFFVAGVGTIDGTILSRCINERVARRVLDFAVLYKPALRVLLPGWLVSAVFWNLVMWGILPPWYSFLCMLGFPQMLFVYSLYDLRIFLHTALSLGALVPELCILMMGFCLCDMVRYDARVVAVVWCCLACAVACWDDAALHNNSPADVTKLENAVAQGMGIAGAAGSKMGFVLSMVVASGGLLVFVWGLRSGQLDGVFVSNKIGDNSKLATFTTGSLFYSAASVYIALSLRMLWYAIKHPMCLVMNRVPVLRHTRIVFEEVAERDGEATERLSFSSSRKSIKVFSDTAIAHDGGEATKRLSFSSSRKSVKVFSDTAISHISTSPESRTTVSGLQLTTH